MLVNSAKSAVGSDIFGFEATVLSKRISTSGAWHPRLRYVQSEYVGDVKCIPCFSSPTDRVSFRSLPSTLGHVRIGSICICEILFIYRPSLFEPLRGAHSTLHCEPRCADAVNLISSESLCKEQTAQAPVIYTMRGRPL